MLNIISMNGNTQRTVQCMKGSPSSMPNLKGPQPGLSEGMRAEAVCGCGPTSLKDEALGAKGKTFV